MSIKVPLVQSWRALAVVGLAVSAVSCDVADQHRTELSPLTEDALGIRQMSTAYDINGGVKQSETEIDLVPPKVD